MLDTTPSSLTPKLPEYLKGSKEIFTRRRLFSFFIQFLLFDAFVIIAVIAISYAFPLPHPYLDLAPLNRTTANPRNQKVFIAANIVNAELIRGAWGDSVLELIDLLGAENAYLSIYENDSGSDTKSALHDLESRVHCAYISTLLYAFLSLMLTIHPSGIANSSIVSGSIPLSSVPHTVVTGPQATTYIDRIEYLSVVRNNALAPLHAPDHTLPAFDKLLFLNDVYFDPSEAIQLMFDTNNGSYNAACAMDFRDPFKYYDTFATRDIHGNELGIPIYPWFAPGESQDAVTRHDKEIPVTSCWGGMVSFDARPFQTVSQGPSTNEEAAAEPVRFRHSGSTEWEGAECCLVHSDLRMATMSPAELLSDRGLPVGHPRGTFVNQYVRTMYDGGDWKWREFGRKVQWAFTPFHRVVTWIIMYPRENKRRLREAIITFPTEADMVEWQVKSEAGEVHSWKGSSIDVALSSNSTEETRMILDPDGGYCGTGKCMALIEETRKWYILPHCFSSDKATIVSAESWAEGSRRAVSTKSRGYTWGRRREQRRTTDFYDRYSRLSYVEMDRDRDS